MWFKIEQRRDFEGIQWKKGDHGIFYDEKIPIYLKSDANGIEKKLFEDLLGRVKRDFPEKCYVRFILEPGPETLNQLMQLSVGGDIINLLHKLFILPEDSRNSLELELVIYINPRDSERCMFEEDERGSRKFYIRRIDLSPEKLPNSNRKIVNNNIMYTGSTDMPVTEDDLRAFILGIEVKRVRYTPLLDVLDRFDNTRLEQFHSQAECDFAIISNGGKRFPCHYQVLKDRCFYLETKLELCPDVEEFTIEVSNDAVYTFLEFIYSNRVDLKKDLRNSSLLLIELLRVADIFGVSSLWTAAARLLYAEVSCELSVDDLLKFYEVLLHTNHGIGTDYLKSILLRLLSPCFKTKEQISGSGKFKEMFPTEECKTLFFKSWNHAEIQVGGSSSDDDYTLKVWMIQNKFNPYPVLSFADANTPREKVTLVYPSFKLRGGRCTIS